MMRLKYTLSAALAIAAIGATPGVAAAKSYSPLDKYMLQSSIQGDRFEIAGGKLAQAKGATPEAKALGARLVKDHTKSLAEAVTVAKRLKISVPKTPTPVQEWELQMTGALAGAAFDVAYAGLEVQDHKMDIEDNKTEAKEGLNARVRALAREDLPTLRQHLALSRQLLAMGR